MLLIELMACIAFPFSHIRLIHSMLSFCQVFCPDTNEDELNRTVKIILDLYDFEREKVKV